MERNLVIIDGDSLCYLCSKDTLSESIANIDSLILKILDRTGSRDYYLFLSEGKYFRHNVNTDYKGKRSPGTLKYLKTLKQYLREQYLGESWRGVEADDAVAYAQQQFIDGKLPQFSNTYIAAIDKDVKKQVQGHMYDYRTDEFSITLKEEAEKFLHIQSIMGDSTDNITGIPGKGEKKASDLLLNVPLKEQSTVAFNAYKDHYKSIPKAIHEYQKNFKQVYILRTDEDFQDAVGYIPTLNDPITIVN